MLEKILEERDEHIKILQERHPSKLEADTFKNNHFVLRLTMELGDEVALLGRIALLNDMAEEIENGKEM